MTTPLATTLTDAQSAFDHATLRLSQAITSARQQRDQMCRAQADLATAREAFQMADLVLTCVRQQPAAR